MNPIMRQHSIHFNIKIQFVNLFKSVCLQMINRTFVGNYSECGTLKSTIMHRPGDELKRLREDNLDQLLFDAIPNLDETHRSHDYFTECLRNNDVQVLEVENLLYETLQNNRVARKKLIDGIVTHREHPKKQNQFRSSLRQWLLRRTSKQLVHDVICGVRSSTDELGVSSAGKILFDTFHHIDEFVIPPLPNLVFTRDSFSVIEKNVFIWNMAKAARQNEPLLFRIIFQYHRELSNSGLKIVHWQTEGYENATVEGGDVAFIGDGVLLIGCGERTNHLGIEAIFQTNIFRRIIVVHLPAERDYMHLDTILSSVGKHSFVLHGRLADKMQITVIDKYDENNNLLLKTQWKSYGYDIRDALRRLLNDPDLIFYDAEDEDTSVEEQRACRHNMFAVGDCHVLTYAGGHVKKGIVAQMTRNDACQVDVIPPEGLIEGCGGMHCMTNALSRFSSTVS